MVVSSVYSRKGFLCSTAEGLVSLIGGVRPTRQWPLQYCRGSQSSTLQSPRSLRMSYFRAACSHPWWSVTELGFWAGKFSPLSPCLFSRSRSTPATNSLPRCSACCWPVLILRWCLRLLFLIFLLDAMFSWAGCLGSFWLDGLELGGSTTIVCDFDISPFDLYLIGPSRSRRQAVDGRLGRQARLQHRRQCGQLQRRVQSGLWC
jgi:hypothetical protein